MQNILHEDYFIGLDVGTSSVGWAVTNNQYELSKFKGKHMWGVHLFDEASTAQERRLYRDSRRTRQRYKDRIYFLQQLFFDEISKIDPSFFIRLRESKFKFNDKDFSNASFYTKNILFNDPNFKDKDFYKKYPTIYHLRKALIDDQDDAFDIRFVYLALHHIYKHRGHFLYNNLNTNTDLFANLLENFNFSLESLGLPKLLLDENQITELKKVLSSNLNTTEKKNKLLKLCSITSKDERSQILSLLAGSKLSAKNVFSFLNISSDTKIDLNEDIEEIVEELDTIDSDIIVDAKALYNWGQLELILKGQTYLSDAKIEIYNKHKKDLALLKYIAKDHPELKEEIFYKGKYCYQNYVCHLDNINKKEYKKNRDSHLNKIPYLDFKKNLKKVLEGKINADLYNSIMSDCENQNFLPIQKDSKNSLIPYQVNEKELLVILENAAKRFPFLNEVTDSSNLTNLQKIHKKFVFTIPYFVGPLNTKSKFSWVVRSNGAITPWNFEKVVDLKETAARFIQRMTQKCTYLGTEVLPQESLLYSEFLVLDQINNLRVDDVKISVELKKLIFNEVFLKNQKVTVNSIKDYCVSNGFMDRKSKLSGLSDNLVANLKNHIRFKDILSREDINGYEIVEDLIRTATIFPKDGAMLKSHLEEKYSKIFTETEISKLSKFTAKGWGRLSKEFLTDVYIDLNGERSNIINFMKNNNLNLMQVLDSRNGFIQEIIKRKQNVGALSVKEFLSEAYVSPSIKRSILASYEIIKEIIKVKGYQPKRIFIEVARENNKELKSKKTLTRKDKLLNLYSQLKDPKFTNIKLDLSNCSNEALSSEKVYLYYTQLGKCMYSTENSELSIHNLHMYDVDHIYPRSKVVDNSIDNKVLVKRTLNQGDKKDIYPIPAEIREKRHSFWEKLYKNKLISKIKYERLTRKTPLTDDELADFNNRQLVETRQSTKVLAELLKLTWKDTEIVYSKAQNVKEFLRQIRKSYLSNKKRDENDFYFFTKCRKVNNLHHAKDAYLNIVVGNCYRTKYDYKTLEYIKKNHLDFNVDNIFSYVIKSISGEIAWNKNITLDTVKKMYKKNDATITYRQYEKSGKIFSEMKRKNSKEGYSYPLKSKDSRYSKKANVGLTLGGFKTADTSFFVIVKSVVKNVEKKQILPILIKDKDLYIKNPSAYIKNILNCDIVDIIIPKLMINTIFELDGIEYYLTGKTNNNFVFQVNNSLVLDPKWHNYINYLYKVNAYKDESDWTIYDKKLLTVSKNLELFDLLISKINNTNFKFALETLIQRLKEKRESFISWNIKDQIQLLCQIINQFNNLGNIKFKDITSSRKVISFSRITDKGVIINRSICGFFESKKVI